MQNPNLTGQQKALLRSLGQTLDVSLSVGREGVTDAVLKELERQFSARELVKVKLLAERNEREALMEALAAGSRARIAGSVGKTVLLYRTAPESHPDRLDLPGNAAG
jgi:RNA-binding protein